MLYSIADDVPNNEGEETMGFELTFPSRSYSTGQKDVQYALPIPMVYEHVPADPARWEYHVLTVDTREEPLPDAVQLNELGSKGWVLVGVLNLSESPRVQYYFVRQLNK
jgi:hypothetical protein